MSKTRFEVGLRVTEQFGLLHRKSGRIGGQVQLTLVKQATRQTGIETDTDLLEFALARGVKRPVCPVDPALDLGT